MGTIKKPACGRQESEGSVVLTSSTYLSACCDYVQYSGSWVCGCSDC